MVNPATLAHHLLPDSLPSTSLEPNGSGWSVTYDCFMFSANLHSNSLFPRTTGGNTNGFLVRLQLSHLLNPLYLLHDSSSSSFLLDSSFQLLHFPSSHFSSYSSIHRFVLSTLSHLSLPTSDPDPLVRLIFSFAQHHLLSSLSSLIPLFISFSSTTLLRDHSQALDWLHGGTPDSHILRTFRSTSESLRRLKDIDYSNNLSSEEKEDASCMVCLEGFVQLQQKKRVCRLPCSHLFHYECVSEWLKLDHRCPVCRSPMPWVQSLFPDHTLSSSSSTTDDEYDDHDFDVASSLHPIQPQPGFFTKLSCFLKKTLQHMLA